MQSVSSLNFEPVKPWPDTLPALSWNGYIYAGFGREKIAETYRFNQRFETAFFEAYPHLGLAELTRFYFLELPFRVDWTFFFSMYRLRFTPELVETLKLVRTLPPLFQLWIDERECTPRDIAPLARLNYDDRTRLALHFAHARPAKSQGVQALEWATDLLLLKRDIFSQVEIAKMYSFEKWFNWLKVQRFPMVETRRSASTTENRLDN